MKRVAAFLLLLIHINTYMLLPHTEEMDVFDVSGQQVDDVNSIAEYIDEVVMGHADITPEDEDDDQGQSFQAAYYLLPTCQVWQNLPTPVIAGLFVYKRKPIVPVYRAISTPPPKAIS